MKGVTASMNARGLGLLLLLAATPAVAEEERWVIDGEITASHDSNASRAERDRDIIADSNVLANVGLVLLTEPTFSTSLNLRLFAETEAWQETDTLDRQTGGGQAMLRWAPWRGYRAPVLGVNLTAQVDDYEVRQRDSGVATLQVFARQRINDRISASYGLEATERRSEGTVFDNTQGRVFLNTDLELDALWTGYANYSHLRGDTFSSAQVSFCNGVPATDIWGLIGASEAIEDDEALSDTYCGRWVAYRLKAQTHSLTLGLNRGFGHSLSADVSVQGIQVNGQGDNDYRRLIVRAGLLGRF